MKSFEALECMNDLNENIDYDLKYRSEKKINIATRRPRLIILLIQTKIDPKIPIKSQLSKCNNFSAMIRKCETTTSP